MAWLFRSNGLEWIACAVLGLGLAGMAVESVYGSGRANSIDDAECGVTCRYEVEGARGGRGEGHDTCVCEVEIAHLHEKVARRGKKAAVPPHQEDDRVKRKYELEDSEFHF